MKKYELEEHAADIAISVEGGTIEKLFINLANGLLEEMVDIKSIAPGTCDFLRQNKEIFTINFSDHENALIQFLNRIIYMLDAEKKMPLSFNLEFNEGVLSAGYGYYLIENIIKKRHIKSAAHCDVKIEKTENGFRTKVIFDI